MLLFFFFLSSSSAGSWECCSGEVGLTGELPSTGPVLQHFIIMQPHWEHTTRSPHLAGIKLSRQNKLSWDIKPVVCPIYQPKPDDAEPSQRQWLTPSRVVKMELLYWAKLQNLYQDDILRPKTSEPRTRNERSQYGQECWENHQIQLYSEIRSFLYQTEIQVQSTYGTKSIYSKPNS